MDVPQNGGDTLKKEINANINRSHIMDMFENHVLGIFSWISWNYFNGYGKKKASRLSYQHQKNLISGCVTSPKYNHSNRDLVLAALYGFGGYQTVETNIMWIAGYTETCFADHH